MSAQPQGSGRSLRLRRRSGRLTPYSCRRNGVVGAGENSSSRPEAPHRQRRTSALFNNLVSKTCHVYRVSPLWKFETAERNLKEYSQQLTGLLQALPHPPSHGHAAQKRGSPYVGVVKVVKDFNSNGQDSIVVTVGLGSASKMVCVAVLLPSIEEDLRAEKGFSYYPLMLLHGSTATSQVLMDWMKTSFDCSVVVRELEETCLHKLAAKYATTLKRVGGRGEKAGGLHLLYELPDPVKEAGLSTISVELPYNAALALNKEDQMLERMIHTHLHLKLSSLKLVKIATSVLLLHCNGTIKCGAAEHMLPILTTIQQECV